MDPSLDGLDALDRFMDLDIDDPEIANELLQWTRHLDFDSYLDDWTSMACTREIWMAWNFSIQKSILMTHFFVSITQCCSGHRGLRPGDGLGVPGGAASPLPRRARGHGHSGCALQAFQGRGDGGGRGGWIDHL